MNDAEHLTPVRARGVGRAGAAAIGLLLIVGASSPAAAQPPTRESSTFTGMTDCESPAVDLGTPVLDIFLNDVPRAEVIVYDGPERNTVIASTAEPLTLDYDGARARGEGVLVDAVTGEPLGRVAAEFEVVRGQTEVQRWKSADGNHLVRHTDFVTPVLARGTLSVLGADTSIDCPGQSVVYNSFANDPAATVGYVSTGYLWCDVTGEDGRRLLLGADSTGAGGIVLAADGTPMLLVEALSDDRELISDRVFAGTLTIHDLVGTADPAFVPFSLPVELGRERTRSVEDRPTGRMTSTVRSLSVMGAVEIPEVGAFPLDGCAGEWVDERWQFRPVVQRTP